MDARTTDSDLATSPRLGLSDWIERASADEKSFRAVTWGCAILLGAIVAFSVIVLRRDAAPGTLLSPVMIAALLIANLVPAIVLMVLLSRRIALGRAERGNLGTGRLHTRLVALFSVIAAVPTVLVAIFSSLLFQAGLQFWFSDRARTMLENTVVLARSAYDREVERVSNETVTMSGDLSKALKIWTIDDPKFVEVFGRQVLYRNLSEAAIVTVDGTGQIRTLAIVNPYDRPLDRSITPDKVAAIADAKSVPITSSDRVGALTRLDFGPNTYLYASRRLDPEFQQQIQRGNAVLADYQGLIKRSQSNQLKFNLWLLIGSILIVGVAIFIALQLADRLLRPVGELVNAAGRIEEGDLTARVSVSPPADEIAMLGTAFNRMTGRLQEQTGALIAANAQLETRRAFMEAVLSSVTAGVIALDTAGNVLLVNRSAELLLNRETEELEGRGLADISPEFSEFWAGDAREATVAVAAEGGQRTLAVKRMRYADGGVMTFDDITDQLTDQRRAAWSDIARRIAHEIKNPLTPIQLAAERLQRRYGSEIQADPETFARLTETIVRQVGDLRRMVDEFSNFARMPKPVFREENLHEIARAALFLHEVAHPGISFSIEPAQGPIMMVGDRRQLSQALTNVVKNAVEAIEARRNRGDHSLDGDRVDVQIRQADGQIVIDVLDTGVGLPEDRERLTEPYMTTRVRGTGLGLAIVKKIVEEHLGEIAFLDRRHGGTHVRIAFDADGLARLGENGPADGDRFDDEEQD
ncbi:ATP-binding protein [Sphingomonas sp. ASV193]|uniref:sensor histidine kinase n=1 Tax=Sphingomonas sp. ASV193 TaxID=3144405 RepID=UPI0032E9366F